MQQHLVYSPGVNRDTRSPCFGIDMIPMHIYYWNWQFLNNVIIY
jgi:hypothetical protein